MKWAVLLEADFEKWLFEQSEEVQNTILAHLKLLKEYGPALGRPNVDTLKSSILPNLKELRVQYKGSPWRILFVFDPKRQAIVLVGGNKQGNAKWYKKAIPLAEQRYQKYLEETEKNNDEKA